MKKGDLVWDLRLKHIGIVTDTYAQPQINKLYVKIFAAGRETGWILESEVEPVQDERDVVEWEHQSRRRNESVRGR
jgi:hypothetical protein